MTQGVQVAGLYVRDQDEAVEFYVGKVGFEVHTDARNGDYRWLTIQHPDQQGFQLGIVQSSATRRRRGNSRDTKRSRSEGRHAAARAGRTGLPQDI